MGAFGEALLTNGVQAGFVAGTLLSALPGLPDRYDLRDMLRLMFDPQGMRPLVVGQFDRTRNDPVELETRWPDVTGYGALASRFSECVHGPFLLRHPRR